MEWMVCIKGEHFVLKELSKSLASPELSVIKEENEYYLKSRCFNQMSNADEVRNKADELLSLINGASKLVLRARKPIKIHSVVYIGDDSKRKRTYFDLGLEIPIHSQVSVVVNGVEQEIHQADPILDWINVAQVNVNVAKVLRLLSNFGYDWVNLYRIYEVIEDDVKGSSKVIQEGWATEAAIRRFKSTANSAGAAGDSARHGKDTTQPPKNPMTFSEAKSLIETILHNWLRSKI